MLAAAIPSVIRNQRNYPKLGLKHMLCLMFIVLLSQYELFFLSQQAKKPTTFSNTPPLSLGNCPISPNSIAIVTAPMGGRGDIDAMRHMIETALELNKAAIGIINLGGIFSSPKFFQQANPIFGQIDPNPKMEGCLPTNSNIKSYRVAIKGKKIPLFIAPDALSLVDIADLINPLGKIIGPTPIFLNECNNNENELCKNLTKSLYGQNDNSGKTLIVTEAGLPDGINVAYEQLEKINFTHSNLQHLPLGLPNIGFLGEKPNRLTPIPCTIVSYDYSKNVPFILLAIEALPKKCTKIGVFIKDENSANKLGYIKQVAEPTFSVKFSPACDKETCIKELKKFSTKNQKSDGQVKKTITLIPYKRLPDKTFEYMALLSYIFFASGDGSSAICQLKDICTPIMANQREWPLQIYKHTQQQYPELTDTLAKIYLSNAADIIEHKGTFYLKIQKDQQVMYEHETGEAFTIYDEKKPYIYSSLSLLELKQASTAMKVGNNALDIIETFIKTGKIKNYTISEEFQNHNGSYNISTSFQGG